MVRINLIAPSRLADQHLIAEYNEILMLLGYVKKYPNLIGIPRDYCLGKGHIIFFKNKLSYLKQRHEQIKSEMKKRGFIASKRINLSKYPEQLIKNWKPNEKDFKIIKKRLTFKINKKPNFYRYYGEKKSKHFFLDLLNKSLKEKV